MELDDVMSSSEETNWYRVQGSDAEAEIKKIKPKRMDELRNLCKMKIMNGRRFTETINEKKLNKLMLDESVINWRNIISKEQPLPCTLENKILLDDNWQEFRDLWNTILLGGEEAELLRVEEERKN